MATFGARIVPSLLARDLEETMRFYTERLGFAVTGRYPDDDTPVWIEVSRDGIVLQFYRDAPVGTSDQPVLSGALYLLPDSVADLARELGDTVEFEWGPEEMPYGMREFAVRDCNGYLLAFTEPA